MTDLRRSVPDTDSTGPDGLTVERLTARQLNRATLGRQLLLRREKLKVVDGVHRVVALQAQEPASPYIALWNRLEDFDAKDLDRAFARHTIVKASLMRVTMHAVTASDYPAFHEGMQKTLRAARLNDRRFTAEGVTVENVEALVPDLLEFASAPRKNADVEAWLEQRFGAPKPRIWWALRHYGPFVHAAGGEPWSFPARPSYIGAPVLERAGDVEGSMGVLIRRFLEGFGPASPKDIAQFALWYRPWVRDALEPLRDSLVRLEGPDGAELLDVPGGLLPPEESPAPPHLLPMWDSVLLAYADRSRLIPPDYRRRVIQQNGDVLPALLVDGYVVGIWRPVEGGIEATAFQRLTDAAWEGLETEARGLVALLADREPLVYRRYAHWWAKLPGGHVRVLPG